MDDHGKHNNGLAGTPSSKSGFSDASDSKKIALFIPSAEDSSNAVINLLIRKIMEETTFNVVIFCVDQPRDERIHEVPELDRWHLLHSRIYEDVVFPFLETQGLENLSDSVFLPPSLLSEKYEDRVTVEAVSDPNSPEFVQRIKNDPAIELAFSIRNLVLFRKDIINAFHRKGDNGKTHPTLLNVHPGLLPDLKGLFGPFWSRLLGMDDYSTSIHVIDEGIDTGPVLDVITKAVNGDAKKSVAGYQNREALHVAGHIFDIIVQRLKLGRPRNPVEQPPDAGVLKSMPKWKDIIEGEKRGINFDSAEEVFAHIERHYLDKRDDHEMHNALKEAVSFYYYTKYYPEFARRVANLRRDLPQETIDQIPYIRKAIARVDENEDMPNPATVTVVRRPAPPATHHGQHEPPPPGAKSGYG